MNNKIKLIPLTEMENKIRRESLKAWYDDADYKFATNSNEVILNHDADHALYLIKLIFQKANHLVNIATTTLAGIVPASDDPNELKGVEIYNDKHLIESIKKFLNKSDAQLNILAYEDIDQESVFFREVFCNKNYENKINIKVFPQNKQLVPIDLQLDFTYADTKAIRFESSPSNKISPYKAIGYSSNDEWYDRLNKVFYKLWNKNLNVIQPKIIAI